MRTDVLDQRNKASLTFSQIDRCRWNVFDLVTIVAKDAIPCTLLCEIDMTWVEDLRSEYLEKQIRITETAFLLKAIAQAQLAHPLSRTISLPFGRFSLLKEISAGFTVERTVDGQASVFFCTIEEPQKKDLETIMRELSDFSKAAIENQAQLKLQYRFSRLSRLFRQLIFRAALFFPKLRTSLVNASFGLSSLGKYGVTAVTGPCVCTSTFGVGAIESRPFVMGGELQIRPQMTLALLVDERCIDSGSAGKFLADVKMLLEGGLAESLQVSPVKEDHPCE